MDGQKTRFHTRRQYDTSVVAVSGAVAAGIAAYVSTSALPFPDAAKCIVSALAS